MLTMLIVALSIATIVAIHEACHMLVSKLFGVKVLKFSLGFGPLLFAKQYGDTSYELRALPLGGFVQCEGEDPETEVENGFFSLPWYKRALIALAGPVANLLLGFLLILAVLVFARGWPLAAGFMRASTICWTIISATLHWICGIGTPLTPAPHVSDLSGPIMVTKILIDAVKDGFVSFTLLLSFVSLSLGLFNLFPIPSLDGGHVFLYLLEGLRGKKFSTKTYIIWGYIGYVLLIAFMLFTCGLDISKLSH